MIIDFGNTGVVDMYDKPISVGDAVIMWRPDGLSQVKITKYNTDTKQMGVETDSTSGYKWRLKRFSTPYQKDKFYII